MYAELKTHIQTQKFDMDDLFRLLEQYQMEGLLTMGEAIELHALASEMNDPLRKKNKVKDQVELLTAEVLNLRKRIDELEKKYGNNI